jgi:hypothetical protein
MSHRVRVWLVLALEKKWMILGAWKMKFWRWRGGATKMEIGFFLSSLGCKERKREEEE